MKYVGKIFGKFGYTLALGCLLLPVTSFAAVLQLLVVQSDNSVSQQVFSDTLRRSLPGTVQMTVLPHPEDYNGQPVDLIVTVGYKAADSMAGKSTRPLLAAMLPSDAYPDVLAQRATGSQTSAIYLDQPWSRQVAFLHAALPEAKKIGVLHSLKVQLDLSGLLAALARYDLSLFARPLREDQSIFDGLEKVLVNSDVLLALPDVTIYNSNTIRNILLSSYRHGIALVGFSQAYVKAGAMCAIYSTPEQLAAQAGVTILSYASSARLPAAQFSTLYSISINQEVARSLGFSVLSAEALRLQIEALPGESR